MDGHPAGTGDPARTGAPDDVPARFAAVVLAGGTARRLGGTDKPALVVGGRTLLQRALDAVADAVQVAVVGPERPVTPRATLTWCREEPAGGGPVAALAAGLRATAGVGVPEFVVVLAADLPAVAPAVPELLAALAADPQAGAAALTDDAGRVNHLAAAWRRPALAAALDRIGPAPGAAMRRVAEGVAVVRVPDPQGWGRDCDTWDDLAAAREGAP